MTMMSGTNMYFFTHKKEDYLVEWKESDRILKLTYSKEGKELGTNDIKLLGVINQKQLDQIIKEYWKSFVKNTLKDID